MIKKEKENYLPKRLKFSWEEGKVGVPFRSHIRLMYDLLFVIQIVFL